MKTSKKVWLIVAICLVVGGAMSAMISLAMTNFDFAVLATASYTPQTYVTAESFDSIAVRTDTDDIRFAPSADNNCRVEYFKNQKVFYTFAVQEHTLLITREDERRWYDHIGIFWDDTPMTVYLPQRTYETLSIDADTSDILMPADFQFGSVSIETDTGDIRFDADVTGTLDLQSDTGAITVNQVITGSIALQTDTGDIAVTAATVADTMRAASDTGEIAFADVQCALLESHSDTGDIILTETMASADFVIENGTGDVIFSRADAATITVNTDTGEVEGTLLSEKVFITESATGSVDVPPTVDGGVCKVTTVTGDIAIAIA